MSPEGWRIRLKKVVCYANLSQTLSHICQRFNDVGPGNVFYNFIDRLAVLNITLGCTPDHSMYCPNDAVTRGQMAAFLVRAFNL